MKDILPLGLLVLVFVGPVRADDTHRSLTEETLKEVDAFTDILKSIKDKNKADEAKPKIEAQAKTMLELRKRSEKLGEPTKETKADLDKEFKTKFAEAIKRLQDQMIRIATSVDGGQDIVKDIRERLAPLSKAKDKK